MKKIAFINQRYGAEVAGGSEAYTKAMAEHLATYFRDDVKVEVLTSKAIDFKTWRNAYEKDEEIINGVLVRRFSVKRERSRVIQRGTQILMHNLHIHTRFLEEWRLKGRGPYVPELVQYIKDHKDEYDAFIFVTYMYYPAYFGAKEVYDKAYFVPTAHDEEPIYMNVFKDLFTKVRGIIYLTEEEKKLAHRLFHNEAVKHQVIGMGIETPENVDVEQFCQKFGIAGKYLLYAGRVNEEKGCKELIDYFEKWNKDKEYSLVLMGKTTMEIPKSEDVKYLGFVSEEDKYAGMKGAEIICLPSKYESFSISLLEGMSYGIPGLVNGNCPVLKQHMQLSDGGIAYTNYEEFSNGLNKLLEERKQFGKNAAEYVKKQYFWEEICKKFEDFID